MKRVIAALVLLVVLATPVKAQNYNTTTGSTDSVGVKTTTPSNMNSTNGSTTTTDQNNMNNDNMNNENGTSSSTLPKTASPLPLLSLGSLGALASSWWLSRRRRA